MFCTFSYYCNCLRWITKEKKKKKRNKERKKVCKNNTLHSILGTKCLYQLKTTTTQATIMNIVQRGLSF